ncbi:hypothetical protein BUALT_Bualt03G0196600 [Buddleja alternifolia]|uniref:Ty3 transposon capsid-like protein domain-containing protein n=1 Tax=Buddleja alternifolia TaxID=168488 RepID=A0AAV6Y3Q2_9LAMI|nr:hypothetical protein BUALT_Bualt03G0196600 [Buddleja alternifolia]
MVDTRSGEVRRDMDMVIEQMRINKESTDRDMAELRTMMANVMAAQNAGNRATGVGCSQDQGDESQFQRNAATQNQGYNMATKCSKVEFPRFNGEDLRGWIFKCEQFFEVDETPFDAKEVYVRALYARFGALLYEDPMAELMNLKQTGSVKDYLDRFDELLNNVELSETYAISCFLAGLKNEIAIQVRMFKPKSLQEAISLSKLQEQSIQLNNRKTCPNPSYKSPSPFQKQPPLLPTPHYKIPHSQNFSPSSPSFSQPQYQKSQFPQNPGNNTIRNSNRPNGRRLSHQEMEDKRAKGLCSKKRQLFLLEVGDDEDESDKEEAEPVVNSRKLEVEEVSVLDRGGATSPPAKSLAISPTVLIRQ